MSVSRFTQPDFIRIAWASLEARAVWNPRIERVSAALREISRLMVAEDIVKCATVSIPVKDLAAWSQKTIECDLVALPLGNHEIADKAPCEACPKDPEETNAEINVIIGSIPNARRLKKILEGDPDVLEYARLAGYPECCGKFLVDEMEKKGVIDCTWSVARNTLNGGRDKANVCQLPQSAHLNILWKKAGLSPIPHVPCRFDCKESIAMARRIQALGRDAGYEEEMGWMNEILSWPAAWSGLHGIAEIKTPILKFCSNTDFTYENHEIRWTSESTPPEMPWGSDFPYCGNGGKRKSTKRPFKWAAEDVGGAKTVDGGVIYEDWLFSDNGFNSYASMAKAQQTLVKYVRELLADGISSVLDMGCGNGFLLKRIVDACPNAVPYGIDRSEASIAHAALVLPPHKENFAVCDINAIDQYDNNKKRFTLAIIGLCRFEEMSPDTLIRLGRFIENMCHELVVYDYWGRDLERIAKSLGMNLVKKSRDSKVGVGVFGSDRAILDANRLPLPYSTGSAQS